MATTKMRAAQQPRLDPANHGVREFGAVLGHRDHDVLDQTPQQAFLGLTALAAFVPRPLESREGLNIL